MMSETVESLIAYCSDKDRVCPVPQQWNKLWKTLPNRRQEGLSWQPALPLAFGEWYEAPAIAKTLRLTEHIEWAERHGALQAVADFLRALPEDQWFHLSD